MKKISNYLLLACLLFLVSCTTVSNDKVGILIENYGQNPTDVKIVYGTNWTGLGKSSWIIEFPGNSFGIDLPAFNVSSSDGVNFTVDPSLLVQIDKSDAAIQKIAKTFKNSKDEESFYINVQNSINREVQNIVRNKLNNKSSDTIMVSRGLFQQQINNSVTEMLQSYGLDNLSYSQECLPPESLQQSVEQRLLQEQETKTTLAKLSNAKAQIELAQIEQQRMKVESSGYTQQWLEKYKIDKSAEAYQYLGRSNSNIYLGVTPLQLIK